MYHAMLGLFSGAAPGLARCASRAGRARRAAPCSPASITVSIDHFELAGAGSRVEIYGKSIGFVAKG